MTHASNAKRIEYLDILRGLSICFIFFANLQVFSGVLFMSPDTLGAFSTGTLDNVLSNVQITLIQGKFYTLFSLLFGIGMVVQAQRFGNDMSGFKRHMRGRLFVLLMIGVLHMWLVWLGDIITFYALLGFVVLMLFHLSNRALLTLAITFILLPIAHAVLMGVVGFYPGIFFATFTQLAEQSGVPKMGMFEQAMFLAQNPDLGLHANVKFFDPLIRFGMILAEGRLFKVLGILCLGVVAGRMILQQHLLENVVLLKKILLWGLAIGLPCNVGYAAFYYEQAPVYMLLNTVLYALGVVPLALSYAAAVALFALNPHSLLRGFIPLGRMALTCYLSQSVLAIILFNGIGFGLAGKYGLSLVWMIGLAVLTTQWLFCRLWLRTHQQGPLEYAWRRCVPH